MSLSRLSTEEAHFISHRSSRCVLSGLCSRYNLVGPTNYNSNQNPRLFGYGFRGFMSKPKNYNMDKSCIIFHRQFASHAAADTEKKSKKMLFHLIGLVFAMVGCSYAAIPLYKRFCQATSYGGTIQQKESVEQKIARHSKDGTITAREIIVQFNAGMPWKFTPTTREVRVKLRVPLPFAQLKTKVQP